MMLQSEIAEVRESRAAICRQVLDELPEWFGIPDAKAAYIAGSKTLPMFAARIDGEPIGFVSLKLHTEFAAEIYVIGVMRRFHRNGVGRALIDAAVQWAQAQNLAFLTVKTLAASNPDPGYAATRKFYQAMGFLPVEVFPALWDAHNPCLMMVRPLKSTSGGVVTSLGSYMSGPISRAVGDRLSKPRFPRASNYDPLWLMENCMGPHVLWLAEWLSESVPLKPGMHVLDLGCGRAVSSIFFAKEFGVGVTAADLWIKPTENGIRVAEAGMSERVLPVFAEAHSLPFAEGSFDAIVCLDAYHYFGTDDLYVGYISRFLKPDGILGIVVPSVTGEISEFPSSHLAEYWDWDFCSFHSPVWWRRHWEKTGLMDVESADWMVDGWKLWMEWNDACAEFGPERIRAGAKREAEMLRIDNGRTLGFARMIGRRRCAMCR